MPSPVDLAAFDLTLKTPTSARLSDPSFFGIEALLAAIANDPAPWTTELDGRDRVLSVVRLDGAPVRFAIQVESIHRQGGGWVNVTKEDGAVHRVFQAPSAGGGQRACDVAFAIAEPLGPTYAMGMVTTYRGALSVLALGTILARAYRHYRGLIRQSRRDAWEAAGKPRGGNSRNTECTVGSLTFSEIARLDAWKKHLNNVATVKSLEMTVKTFDSKRQDMNTLGLLAKTLKMKTVFDKDTPTSKLQGPLNAIIALIFDDPSTPVESANLIGLDASGVEQRVRFDPEKTVDVRGRIQWDAFVIGSQGDITKWATCAVVRTLLVRFRLQADLHQLRTMGPPSV